MNNNFDHIIAGSGLAGLSLAYRLANDKNYANKRILLIDRAAKTQNDRTWSFWSKKEGLFDHLNYHQWDKIEFADSKGIRQFDLNPYTYKMIRGIDFYEHTLKKIAAAPNITRVTEEIVSIAESEYMATVTTTQGSYTAPYVLKSYPDKMPVYASNFVWQHFKGVIIETEQPAFDPNTAMFMDFRVAQDKETRFFYVLPTSTNRALVEIAIFSKTIPAATFYDPYITSYIEDHLQLPAYKIVEEEIGAIPMTTHHFQKARTKRIIPIGTNGGSVKASSGYAFTRIQRDIEKVHKAIIADRLDKLEFKRNRYHFYDSILLNAILTNKTTGNEIFSKLFAKLSPQTIFKFLDEEGSFFNDLKIFTAPPTLPFLKAFAEEIMKRS